MTFEAIILLALKVSIMLNVLALGLHATLSDATSLFRRPGDLVRAFFSMNVIMPIFALALVSAVHLHPAVKIALVALSVSPVPPLFPRTALKEGCRENYVIGLLVAMALLAIIAIPLAMKSFEAFFGMPLQMRPRSVAVLVLQTILIPVLIGIGVLRLTPSFAKRIAKPIGLLSSALLILSLLPVMFVSARTLFSLIGNGTILALAAFAVLGLIVGYVFAGSEPDKKRVLAIATSARHPGIAAALAHVNFPHEKRAVPAIILYLIVSGILTSAAMKRHKRERIATEGERRRAA